MNTYLQHDQWVVNGMPFASLAAASDYLDYRENQRAAARASASKAGGFGAAIRALFGRGERSRDLADRLRIATQGRIARPS